MRRSLPRPSRRLIAVGAAATALAAGGAFAAQRHWTRRWRAGDDALAEAGLRMVDELVHHDVATSDGGVIHAVELGEGPPIVLVHGVTLSDAVWVRQFAALAGRHRVIAIDQRGHGPSVAGDDGYTFDRLAQDVLEVLEALAVRKRCWSATPWEAWSRCTAALAESGTGWPSTWPAWCWWGPRPDPSPACRCGPWSPRMATLTGRSLVSAERHGAGAVPGEDLASWSTRMAFGSRPTALDLELTRSMTSAMSPTAMADLLVSLVGFDVRARLGEIGLPTRIVAGSRDLLLPPFHARRMAAGIPRCRLSGAAGLRAHGDARAGRRAQRDAGRVLGVSCSPRRVRPDRHSPNDRLPSGGTIRPVAEPTALADLALEASTCTRCPLSEHRTQVVFGVGIPRPT